MTTSSSEDKDRRDRDHAIDQAAIFTQHAPLRIRAFLGALAVCGYELRLIEAVSSCATRDADKYFPAFAFLLTYAMDRGFFSGDEIEARLVKFLNDNAHLMEEITCEQAMERALAPLPECATPINGPAAAIERQMGNALAVASGGEVIHSPSEPSNGLRGVNAGSIPAGSVTAAPAEGPTPRTGRDWRWAAMRLGEMMCATGPKGYYEFTPEQLVEWATAARSSSAEPVVVRGTLLTAEQIEALTNSPPGPITIMPRWPDPEDWNLICPKCGVSPEGPCGWTSNCPTGLAQRSAIAEPKP